ncbi:MAG: alpha/beta fold hydrolase [Microlunatus sp.]
MEWQSTYARVSTIGREGERAFVLVPGIGVSSNYFERLAAQLNGYGPVHALDLPGFGGVPHPKSRRMTICDYADLVGKVIDELGLVDPVLVGHSMGTQVVADLAARYPDGFAGKSVGRPPLSSIVLLGPVLSPDQRRLSRAANRFLAAARKEPPRVAVLAAQAYLLCGVRWFSRVLPEMMLYPIEDTLPKVRSNTLVISGALDTLCPSEWIDQVRELLPSGRVEIIEQAAHSIMHAHADTVAALAVAHVQHPGTEPLPKNVADRAADGDSDSTPDGAAEFTGQITELAGILTDDDEKIAEGKTAQAKAIAEATDGDPA